MNRKYTQEHIDYIAANIQGCPFKELTDMFNKQFGMNLKVSAMISLSARYGLNNGRDTRLNKGWQPTQFKKGHVPFNKGMKGIFLGGEAAKAAQFKKGNKSWNWMPLGSERVNGDGYVDIKIADGQLQKNWKGKHILIWEERNGPVPPGHVVIFGDGNKRNFDQENLLLVSREQLVRLNKMKMIHEDAELTKVGIAIANICNKIGKRERTKA